MSTAPVYAHVTVPSAATPLVCDGAVLPVDPATVQRYVLPFATTESPTLLAVVAAHAGLTELAPEFAFACVF